MLISANVLQLTVIEVLIHNPENPVDTFVFPGSSLPSYIMCVARLSPCLLAFSSTPFPFQQSLSPSLPPSPQHLHRTLCPGQPLIIFAHQNVDQLHFMRTENHRFDSGWTAPRLDSCFSGFTSVSTSRTHSEARRRVRA